MDDRDRLIALYKAIQSIEVPEFENPEINVTGNTIREGFKMMEGWLAKEGQKHFDKTRRQHNDNNS